jgi:hypothetical protein
MHGKTQQVSRMNKTKNKKLRIKFVPKSEKVMGDYIALHKKTTHLPKKFKKIKGNEVWVRKDWWNDEIKRTRIKTHEKVELNLMRRGVPYKKAHQIANKFEKNAYKIKLLKNKLSDKKYIIARDPIINKRVLFLVVGNNAVSMITGYKIKLNKKVKEVI